MKHSLFESFAHLVTNIPASAIFRTLELEARMLEDDLRCKRTMCLKEAKSILRFCRFVVSAKSGLPPRTPVLPNRRDHVCLYRKVIIRLIAAGEMPPCVEAEFESSFSHWMFEAAESSRATALSFQQPSNPACDVPVSLAKRPPCPQWESSNEFERHY